MTYKKQCMICVLTNAFMVVALLFAVTYCVEGNRLDKQEFPYGLSKKYQEYHQTEQKKVKFDDRVNLKKETL